MVHHSPKVAFVFPGQGSQQVGMGRDVYDGSPAARKVFSLADEVLGFPLTQLCFEGPEAILRQTLYAQPAIFTVSMASLAALQEAGLRRPSFVAGHSLGEYTALAASRSLDFPHALLLVQERGRLMHEASLSRPGGMAAVLGLDDTTMEEICQETGAEICNVNGPRQIVVGGDREALARTLDLAQARGAKRTILLEVSGAFHSSLMSPAVKSLHRIISPLSFRDPEVPIIANTTARPMTSAGELKRELVVQLTGCVQWKSSVEYLIGAGVSTFIEVGPGRVLSGLIKHINPRVEIKNIGEQLSLP